MILPPFPGATHTSAIACEPLAWRSFTLKYQQGSYRHTPFAWFLYGKPPVTNKNFYLARFTDEAQAREALAQINLLLPQGN